MARGRDKQKLVDRVGDPDTERLLLEGTTELPARQSERAPVMESGLPSSVRDVVGRRVERLGDEALRVSSFAAVIGREFVIDLLAALADVDEDALLDLMDQAVSAAVVVESADTHRYRFAHALIQHSLCDELSATRQRAVSALSPQGVTTVRPVPQAPH